MSKRAVVVIMSVVVVAALLWIGGRSLMDAIIAMHGRPH
jgi:uncharacterized membrane protein